MEYYEKDGKVAVMVCVAFDSGWATRYGKEIAYDKRVVELFLKYRNHFGYCTDLSEYDYNRAESDLAKKIAKEIAGFGYRKPFMSDFWDCTIEWVPKGKPFIITEYGCHEKLALLEDLDVICF